jgi:hypothetical protein
VLLDRTEGVQKHHIKAGSLSLMLSRYAFHRVPKVEHRNPGFLFDAGDRKMIFGPAPTLSESILRLPIATFYKLL